MMRPFQPLAVASGASCVYRVDASGRIVYVDDGWVAFARANGAAPATTHPVGTLLFDAIAGDDVRELFRDTMRRVRTTAAPIHIPFRCDAPTMRRAMGLTLVPLADGLIEFRSRIVLERETARIPVLDPDAPRSHATVRVCSICKNVELAPDRWTPLESAALLLSGGPAPRVVHAVCPECRQSVRAA